MAALQKRVQRWNRDWNVSRGTIPVGEKIAVETMRKKSTGALQSSQKYAREFTGAKKGVPYTGTRNEYSFTGRHHSRDRPRPLNGTRFFHCGEFFQATVTWQWFNKYTEEVTPKGSCCGLTGTKRAFAFPGAVAGLVVRRALSGEFVAPAKRPLHHTTRGQRREAFTLIEFICAMWRSRKSCRELLWRQLQLFERHGSNCSTTSGSHRICDP